MEEYKGIDENATGAKARLEKATVRKNKSDKSDKKTKTSILLVASGVILAIVLLLAVVFFGNDSAKGTWELYSIEQGGNAIEGEALEAQYGGKILYHLNSDESLVVVQLGQEIIGTWTEEEDIVFFHYSSSVKELHRDGDTMILEQNGGVYTFIR